MGLLNGARSITLANAFNMPVKLGTVAPAGSGPQVFPDEPFAAAREPHFDLPAQLYLAGVYAAISRVAG